MPARLPKGTELDGYIVEGWVRDGGMAAIYRARRASDTIRVALKLQLPSTTHVPEICRRFDSEAEAMRRVTGAPHVVVLHHTGVLDDERRYFMMEWVEGENLEERLDSLRNEDKRFPVQDVCELGLDIAKGLATMHEHQLVHRDLKPSNVMVGRGEDDTLVVKLVDFGIVADLRAESERTGNEGQAHEQVMGTSAYMAPEQAAGHEPTPAMDVFALGVILYEALTGTCVPPDGWTPESLPTIESQRRNVVPELVSLVRACMSSDVARRPRTGNDVVSRLAVILGQLRAKGARLDPSEVPIRTGGTMITPRSQIPGLEALAARTGETEIALTHAEVSSLSGTIHTPMEPPRATVVTPVPQASAGVVATVQAVSASAAAVPSASVKFVAPALKLSANVVAPVQSVTGSIAQLPVANANVATPVERVKASAVAVPEASAEPVKASVAAEPEVRASAAAVPKASAESVKASAAAVPEVNANVVVSVPKAPAESVKASVAAVPEVKASPMASVSEASAMAPMKPSTVSVVTSMQPASVNVMKPVQPVNVNVIAPVQAMKTSVMVPVELPVARVVAPVQATKTSVMVPVELPRASVMALVPEATVVGQEDDEDDEYSLSKRRWPWMAAVLVPVVAVGAWVLTGTRDRNDASEAPVMVIPRATERQDVEAPTPVPEVDEPSPSPSSVPTEETPTSEASSKSDAKRRGAGSSRASESANDAPKPRPKGPDKAVCEKQHTDTEVAKKQRDWNGLLEATARAACWSGSLKLERQRLRVKAYAELGNYARCVKEGGNSSDSEIVSRLTLCKKKLGA